jgi:hypothetical protein
VGETVSATFDVTVPEDADVSAVQFVSGRFDALDSTGAARYASKPALLQVTPPVTAQLQPIQSVQIYRDWAEGIGMEQIVGFAPTEITLGSGQTGAIPVILTNRSDEDQEVTVSVTLEGADISLDADEQTVTVPANSSTTVDFTASVTEGAAQGSAPVTAMLSYGNYELSDSGTVQIVPILDVARVETAPAIDGDLSEYADLTSYDIAHTAIWEGEVENAEDLSGQFSIAYDDEFLYVAVDVTDQTVVSNIAPNDVKGHWRSDSVEITVDPLGAGVSEHTLTTFKTGIFPFDTEGNVQAERDADANQGSSARPRPICRLHPAAPIPVISLRSRSPGNRCQA